MGPASRNRLFRRCSKVRQPVHWPWWVLFSWDILDWMAFLLWYLYATPSSGDGKYLSDDAMWVFGSCAILYWGPFLPALTLVLPRRQYAWIQLAFDGLEAAFIYLAQQSYKFDASAVWLVTLNVITSAIDAVIFKGPEALDLIISPCLDEFCEHPDDIRGSH